MPHARAGKSLSTQVLRNHSYNGLHGISQRLQAGIWSLYCRFLPFPRKIVSTFSSFSTARHGVEIMAACGRFAFVGRLLSLFLFFRCTTPELVSTGRTVTVNDVPYYVPAKVFATVTLTASLGFEDLVPVTVVGTSVNLRSTVKSYAGSDDVWNAGFLECE